MRPIYLTGERIYLRPMAAGDKDHTVAWYDSSLPVNSVFGEQRLTQLHQTMWTATSRQYAIVRTSNDQIAGGALLKFASGDRKVSISIHSAPLLEDGGRVRAEALQILVPWLLGEHNMRRVDVMLADSDHESREAAEMLGMFPGVRLRQFWRRPGGRVDVLIYQVLNPHEEHLYA